MARKKIHVEEENENWLITYADTITNLLAFFVLIVSVSTIDQTAWSEVNNSVKEKLNQSNHLLNLKNLFMTTTHKT
jgi:chemotaxis protein MotB